MNRLTKTIAALGMAGLLYTGMPTYAADTQKKEEKAEVKQNLAEQCKDYKKHDPKPEALQHFKKAHEYKDTGDLEKAISEYQKAIELDPEYDEAMNDLGVITDDVEGFEKAGEIYKKAIQLNPCNYVTYYNFGYVLKELGKKTGKKEFFEQALIYYNKSLELNPSQQDAKNIISTINSKYLR